MSFFDYYTLPNSFKAQDIEKEETIPEHELQIGVLDRAIRDFKGKSILHEGNKLYRARNIKLSQKDAFDWFNSKETHEYSFLGICRSLEIEPERIKKLFLNEKPVSRWSTQGRKASKY